MLEFDGHCFHISNKTRHLDKLQNLVTEIKTVIPKKNNSKRDYRVSLRGRSESSRSLDDVIVMPSSAGSWEQGGDMPRITHS